MIPLLMTSRRNSPTLRTNIPYPMLKIFNTKKSVEVLPPVNKPVEVLPPVPCRPSNDELSKGSAQGGDYWVIHPHLPHDEIVDSIKLALAVIKTDLYKHTDVWKRFSDYSTIFPHYTNEELAPLHLTSDLKFSIKDVAVAIYPGVAEEIANINRLFSTCMIFAPLGRLSLAPLYLNWFIRYSYAPIRYPRPTVIWPSIQSKLTYIPAPPDSNPWDAYFFLIKQGLSSQALNLQRASFEDLRRLTHMMLDCVDQDISQTLSVTDQLEIFFERLTDSVIQDHYGYDPANYAH